MANMGHDCVWLDSISMPDGNVCENNATLATADASIENVRIHIHIRIHIQFWMDWELDICAVCKHFRGPYHQSMYVLGVSSPSTEVPGLAL